MGNHLIEKLRPIRRLNPILLAFAGVVLTIGLWAALSHNERQNIRQHVALETTAVRNELVSRMDARFLALNRLVHRSGDDPRQSESEWEADARVVFDHFAGYQAIEWADAKGIIRRTVPLEGNQQAIGFDMSSVPMRRAAMNQAVQTRRMALTDQVELAQGGHGFLALWPLFDADGTHEGFLVGAFRTRVLLEAILQNISLFGYEVAISYRDEELYRMAPPDPRIEQRWAQEQTIDAYGLNWRIHVWPGRELLDDEYSYLPEGVLFSGVVMSILLALTIHLAQVARHKTLQTERINLALQDEIALRRRTEHELRDTALQLRHSNRELEDFASVASHDLQEPLRKILAFGDRLKVKSADTLPPESCDYISRMQSAAGRMQSLISDLLAFSRITTKAQPFVPTDLSAIVSEVIDDLEMSIEQSGGTVEIGSLPTLDADPLQIRQLFQNLISNALKFHKPDLPPKVSIHAADIRESSPDGVELCKLTIQDNGIGFDEKYLDRIFTVFQRLHGRGEYEGTGIGLAVCRKIAERHGGSITAHSRPGEGATFIVILPIHHAKESINHEPQTDHNTAGR